MIIPRLGLYGKKRIVGLEIISSKLSFNNSSEKEDLKILLKKFDNYYYPEETEVQKRFKFFTRRMKTNETMENYVQDLKKQAEGCNLNTLTDSLVRDVIILNTSDEILRQRYMQEENLTCNKIIELYNNHKIYHRQNKTKNSNVQSKEKSKNKTTSKQQEPPSVMSKQKRCWRCHIKHPSKQCPAWNYKCSKCNVFHHFEKCCKSQHNQSQNMSRNPSMNNLLTLF
ncbi:hypothetical protein KPH14_007034 [Odynerus spinipes]|uniref:Retrotransposon gag domain-containing protein n=1 Tax=Odynerus spinipes TaxID=1348599 RepID=A0AAD9RRT5_9HYME|nr:hypothetical protein KPH14_007034 [Odynerus spinipes]